MNLGLAPKIMSPLNKETFLVWFNTSNKYLFLSNDLKVLIGIYLKSENQKTFLKEVNQSLRLPKETSLTYYEEITTLLEECNKKQALPVGIKKSYTNTNVFVNKNYLIDHFYISVNYPSIGIMGFLHNQIEHLAINNIAKNINLNIDIQEDENNFYLYVNKEFVNSYLKTNYHLLQGDFNLILLNLIYQCTEEDWLAMLHGSSISNGKEALILVGQSGNGKSTFTSLMVANGYDLVTDDITPIHATKAQVCSTPSGISIKEGSFTVLNSYTNNFKSSKEFIYSTKKGKSKYITTLTTFKKTKLTCSNIVLIKYKKDSSTELLQIASKNILEAVIPDSWTSPKDENAEKFINWIKNLNYYELSYSNATDAIKKISTLFK